VHDATPLLRGASLTAAATLALSLTTLSRMETLRTRIAAYRAVSATRYRTLPYRSSSVCARGLLACHHLVWISRASWRLIMVCRHRRTRNNDNDIRARDILHDRTRRTLSRCGCYLLCSLPRV